MKREVKDLEELANVPLGEIMDEAVAAAPRIAYYRVRSKVPGHEAFTFGIVLLRSMAILSDGTQTRAPCRHVRCGCARLERRFGSRPDECITSAA